MNLVERIPLAKINFLNNLSYNTFTEYSKSCKNEKERKLKYKLLQIFCETNIKTKGETHRNYIYTLATSLDIGGRLYCGNSIQNLPKDIRGFLMKDTTDIDMKNAHPVILKYICKINNISCPNLSRYVENRDTILLEYGDDILLEYGDEGKIAFLKAVNDDKLNDKITNPFFKDFDEECKVLQKKITSLPCYKEIVETVPSTKIYNWNGSAINRILCVFENKILQECIAFCGIKQIEIAALMFDGLMVYDNLYENFDFLNELICFIDSKFENLKMIFTYKSHSNLIEMPKNIEEFTNIKESKNIDEFITFESICKNFELTHSKIINKGFFIKEMDDTICIMSKSHMLTAYENLIYQIQDKGKFITMNFINDWLRNNPTQRCYDDIECYPDASKCPKNHLNTWKPFAMELVKEYTPMPKELEIFKKHILILCGNDLAVANYFEAWIAQMIQFPAIKSICPTLISKEGAGKGTLMNLLSKMIGDAKYFETSTPSRDVWGDFNGRMASTFLVNLDELSKKESMECEGKIKALITNPSMTINNKGINQYGIISYHRFIGTTNNEDPIKTVKDDRRNLIIRSSDELIGDKEYFKKIYEMLDNVNVIKTCFEYFKSIPNMDNFGKLPMPLTSYQNDMKTINITPIESWLKDFTLEHYYDTTIEIIDKNQYEIFKEWCKKCGIEYNLTSIQFGVKLKRLEIPGILNGKHTNKGNTKIFNFNKLKEHFKLYDIVMDNTTIEDIDTYA